MGVCSECKGADTIPIMEYVNVVGEYQRGGMGILIAWLGQALAKTLARPYFKDIEFCSKCRVKAFPEKDPYQTVAILAGVGFMTFFLFIGSPIGWLFFIAAFVVLRKRLKEFQKSPSASSAIQGIGAIGILATAIVAHTIILAVTVGVFIYMEKQRNKFH